MLRMVIRFRIELLAQFGQRQTPGRVFKIRKWLDTWVANVATILSQQIVKIDQERNLLFIKEQFQALPKKWLLLNHSVKKRGKDGN